MKTSQSFLVIVLAFAGLMQTACTAKVEGVSDLTAPFADPKKASNAFDLNAANGTWSTGCVVSSSGWATEDKLVLNNGAFQSTYTEYEYDECVSSEVYDTTSYSGNFVVVGPSSTAADAYEIQIQTQSYGQIQTEGELVKLEGNTMYFGDHSQAYNGSFPSKIDTTRPFQKVTR